MKIDVFAHILTPKYLSLYAQKNKAVMDQVETKNRAVIDLEVRLRLMERYPDVLEVLTVAQPPLEQFVAAVACLPMNDVDAALKEADRAIKELGLKGVQIYSRVAGETLDSPKFR